MIGRPDRDEVVSRAWDMLVEDGWKPPLMPGDAISRIIARTPADGPEPVAVKALEWKINTLSWKDTWEADSPIGGYSITESIEPSRDNPVEYCVYLRADYVCFKTSIDAAKAAAQADYEPRIRSALTHPVPDGPAGAHSDGRKKGHSKLVYNKQTRTIDKVDPHPADGPDPVAGWCGLDSAPKDGTRMLLAWKPVGGLSEHVELGKWKDRHGWCNTYGHPFNCDPDAWAPLAPFTVPADGPADAVSEAEVGDLMQLVEGYVSTQEACLASNRKTWGEADARRDKAKSTLVSAIAALKRTVHGKEMAAKAYYENYREEEAVVRSARDLLNRIEMYAPDVGVDEFHDAIHDARLLIAKIDGSE